MRRIGRWRGVVLGCGLAAGVAMPALAQRGRFEVTPFAGGYVPTSALGQLRIANVLPGTAQFRGQMSTAGAVGGRLGYWTGQRWGVEGSYFYSSSDFQITIGPVSGTVDAAVQGGSLKAFFRATNENSGTDLFVSGGVMGITHEGQAFRLPGNQFDMGGVVGAGLHVVMSPQLTLRIDGDLMVYSYRSELQFTARTQTDVLMTVGLGFRLGR